MRLAVDPPRPLRAYTLTPPPKPLNANSFPYYYYARFVESQGDGAGHTGDMDCVSVAEPVGWCGGVAKQALPNCSQPKAGVAPDDQGCFDRITDYAVLLAQQICNA